MNKSMYSLILTDEVIARIDRLAYEKGMNRSQLIDHLLAKEVGMHTREHQTRTIISYTVSQINTQESSLHGHMDRGSMEVATYVKYKYNPTIKYGFDIIEENNAPLGLLKIQSRSTAAALRNNLDTFFCLLSVIDDHHHQLFRIPTKKQTDAGRYQRTIVLPRLFENTDDAQTVADRLSASILLVDDTMQSYFNSLRSPSLNRIVEDTYLRHFSQ
ncbi:MAG TPA: hypothetical protein IAC91_00335 [Candidatus Faecimorpha stercoravium]|nr:hypothetical protein [Candidatus Faecimorpha stercoravium]